MGYFLIYLSVYILSFILARMISVCLHEFGHAIPATLMTNEKVILFIGSYGDQAHSFRITVGRLEIWFKKNPLRWQYGMCSPKAKNISYKKQFIYTLLGPLTSIGVTVIMIVFIFNFNLPGVIKLISIFLGFSALWDVFHNLLPNKKSIQLANGNIVYNDGYNLIRLFRLNVWHKKYSEEYNTAANLYQYKKYTEAAALLKKIIADGSKEKHAFQLAISALIMCKDYIEGKELAQHYLKLHKPSSEDYTTISSIYSKLNAYNTALEYLDKALQLNSSNKYALNNKGYILMLLHRFEESIPLYDRAIEVAHIFEYPYNNRGYAKLMLGRLEEGFQDIHHSLKLNSNNSYAHRNMGIYYMKKERHNEALKYFEKAKELDPETEMIDEWLAQAIQKEEE